MICRNCDYVGRPTYDYPCSRCDMTAGSQFCMYEHKEKPTNADKIRAMSDEELAKYLLSISTAECPFDWDCKASTCLECWNKWLQQSSEV
jgi:hypothetical protein